MDVLPVMRAFIDLGTNTFNLAVGEILHGQLHLKHISTQVVMLRKEALAGGELAEAAWDRAKKAIYILLGEARAAGATNCQAVGTSAFRNAPNGADWVNRIRQLFGLPVEVVSGNREAQLIWKGVAAAGALSEDALLIDIGGGSVEFILANEKEIRWLQSIEMGMARLQLDVPWSDPITQTELNRARHWLKYRLQPVLAVSQSGAINRLVGAAGAFDTLYCLHFGAAEPVKLAYVTREAVLSLLGRLLAMSRAERAALPGMPALRVDMQLGAMLLMEALLLNLPAVGGFYVSSWSLREGGLLHG